MEIYSIIQNGTFVDVVGIKAFNSDYNFIGIINEVDKKLIFKYEFTAYRCTLNGFEIIEKLDELRKNNYETKDAHMIDFCNTINKYADTLTKRETDYLYNYFN